MKMVVISTVLSLLFSFCTIDGSNKKRLLQEQYSIEYISKDEFEKIVSQYDFELDKEEFKEEFEQEGSDFQLPVSDEMVVFNDTLMGTDDPRQKDYKFLGGIVSINKYVVEGVYWEYSECLIIDKETGKMDTIWSTPFLSPNSKYIASKSLPYGLEGLPNGIQVFRIEKSEIQKFIEIDQQEWVPKEVAWSNQNTLVFSYIKVEEFWSQQENAPLRYAKLILKDN